MPIAFRAATVFCLAVFAMLALGGCGEQGLASKIKEALDRPPPDQLGLEQPAPEELLADEPDSVIPPPPEPVPMEPAIDKEARVSVLGYHDFTEGKSTNDMIINIGDFREQMREIKDAELPVISMSQYLAWRRGEEDIPPRCVLITIDDGWKATHTLALPVLKEFGFPFTVFLYKNYVASGGRSMTLDEIRELMAAGCEVGSHSLSHQNMSQRRGRGDAEYAEWIRSEVEDSHLFLKENFGPYGNVLKVFAYPYGIYNDQVIAAAEKFGYEACFTVNGRKAVWEEEFSKVGRYMVYGNNFAMAMDFGGGSVLSSGKKLMSEAKDDDGEVRGPLVTTWPEDGQTIVDRLPEVQMNVGQLEGVVADSIVMRVTGLGLVPHRYDPEKGVVSYQMPQRLRSDTCGVQVSFRHAGNKETEVIAWNFKVDLLAGYLPPEVLMKINEDKMKAEAEAAVDPTAAPSPPAQTGAKPVIRALPAAPRETAALTR
ncbi:MAG: polysaccharide deacetylase family protein [Verrucomicrobiae bacterium]|nr:polysaccharide deacetylase family protein [Verrucomicrobiae bacterium]MCP5540429.1 polysaccharide deacetylase family protein [Akkermansiaceae bacterium]